MENDKRGNSKRDAVISAILDQWKKDKTEGKEPSVEEYIDRYPEHGQELRQEIENLELASGLLGIVESEKGFSEEEVKASLERSKQLIAQERARMAAWHIGDKILGILEAAKRWLEEHPMPQLGPGVPAPVTLSCAEGEPEVEVSLATPDGEFRSLVHFDVLVGQRIDDQGRFSIILREAKGSKEHNGKPAAILLRYEDDYVYEIPAQVSGSQIIVDRVELPRDLADETLKSVHVAIVD